MDRVTVIAHPLVQYNLGRLRDQRTEPEDFRRSLAQVAALMIYEATRSLETRSISVTTP
ncbi:MAG: uracil phosphoribosyltransferase, partial [Gammaproteobacteria bacterium]